MTPATTPQSNPRRWKLPLAALATTAALAGGGQLLAPASADAMISDDPACSYEDAFWIDQFFCVNSNDDEGGASSDEGSRSDSGGAPTAGAKPTSDPCADPNIYCVEGTLPKKKETSKTRATMTLGGSAGRPRQQDSDAKGRRLEAKRAGGARRGSTRGSSTRGSSSSSSCENGAVFGCEAFECKVDRQTLFVATKKDCDAAKEAAKSKSKTPAEQLEADRGLCEILDLAISITEQQVDVWDDMIRRELLKKEPDGTRLIEWRNRRDEAAMFRNADSRAWLERGCSQFPPAKGAPGK